MISRIKGILVDKEETFMVIDVSGVGYQVYSTNKTISSFEIGDELIVHVSTQVKEDSILLYGFLAKAERQAFESLLDVSGVGARIALAALSTMNRNDLANAIASSDISALTKIPGVGKKLAQRMLLDLTGKLPVTFEPTKEPSKPRLDDQLSLALAQLGFKRSEIEKAEQEIKKAGAQNESLSDRIRRSLQVLGSQK